jgi:hypothetical protein
LCSGEDFMLLILPFKVLKMDVTWLNIMVVLRHKKLDGAEEKCCFTTGMICLHVFSC